MALEDFDLTGFWEASAYSQKFDCGPLTPEKTASAERALGYKLPASYLHLLETQNGGVPVNRCFPTAVPTSWAGGHIAIETIFGVGGKNDIVSETRLMLGEWGYPAIGIAVCDCPSAGHDEIFLDYRACGPQGEPAVVLVDQEDDYRVTPLAENFEAFIRGLVNDSEFDFEEDEDE